MACVTRVVTENDTTGVGKPSRVRGLDHDDNGSSSVNSGDDERAVSPETKKKMQLGSRPRGCSGGHGDNDDGSCSKDNDCDVMA